MAVLELLQVVRVTFVEGLIVVGSGEGNHSGGKVMGNSLTVPLDDIPSSHTLPYLYSCPIQIFQDLS